MATHSSVLAWRIPGTGEPDGLPSMGSHRVGHDWSDLAAAAADVSTEGKMCLQFGEERSEGKETDQAAETSPQNRPKEAESVAFQRTEVIPP